MPKILLTTLNAKYIHLNLAIRILYDLNKDKADLDFCEFTIKHDIEETASYCAAYDIVCFSCYIWNITETLAVCKAIKEIAPNTKILLGGPEVSYEWEPVIAEDFIDYIIIGEGEIPFSEFVDNTENPAVVTNLVYKQDHQIYYNKQQVQFNVQELKDRNPYQYDDPKELYNKVCYIETSRGCPYKCEFCLASLDNKVRYLPMDTIKSNLLYLMEHGRTIKFLDRTFNIKKDFTIELFQFILDNYKPGQVFQFEITADIVHPDIIAFIQEQVPKGVFRFEIGIQTVNQESNLAVSRKQNFDKTANVIRQLQDYIEMHLDLIVGLPLEYMENLKYSFEQTFALYPPELQLGFLKFLKGTPVREKYEQYDYVFDPLPPYQIIESKFLSKEDLYKITQLENALEIYWNKKRAFHSLRYISKHYSIFQVLMDMGALFESKYPFHQHTLKQVYEVAYEYFSTQFNDPILLELLALDYYTYYKIKPQDLFCLEVDKKTKYEIIESKNLNHHKFRYAIFPVLFDVVEYINTSNIKSKHDVLVIEFNGMDGGLIKNIKELI